MPAVSFLKAKIEGNLFLIRNLLVCNGIRRGVCFISSPETQKENSVVLYRPSLVLKQFLHSKEVVDGVRNK